MHPTNVSLNFMCQCNLLSLSYILFCYQQTFDCLAMKCNGMPVLCAFVVGIKPGAFGRMYYSCYYPGLQMAACTYYASHTSTILHLKLILHLPLLVICSRRIYLVLFTNQCMVVLLCFMTYFLPSSEYIHVYCFIPYSGTIPI